MVGGREILPRLRRRYRLLTHQILSKSVMIPHTLTPATGFRLARTLSSMARSLFAVYAPDCSDAQAFTRRLRVRELHLEGAKAATEGGLLSIILPITCSTVKFANELWRPNLEIGGAILTPDSLTGGEKKLVGSILIFEGETIEEIREMVTNDIYYTSGVVSSHLYNCDSCRRLRDYHIYQWDKEKLVILPFVQAAGTVHL